MTIPDDSVSHPTEPLDEERQRQLRRYSRRATAAVMLLCNGVLVLGIWGSGVDLERLIRMPDQFHPAQHVCLRPLWQKVSGVSQPVRICAEWIDLSDPTGETHMLARETEVVQSADGKLYFDHGSRVDYRLFLLGAFLLAVIVSGIVLERYLIARYRMRLGIPGPRG